MSRKRITTRNQKKTWRMVQHWCESNKCSVLVTLKANSYNISNFQVWDIDVYKKTGAVMRNELQLCILVEKKRMLAFKVVHFEHVFCMHQCCIICEVCLNFLLLFSYIVSIGTLHMYFTYFSKRKISLARFTIVLHRNISFTLSVWKKKLWIKFHH